VVVVAQEARGAAEEGERVNVPADEGRHRGAEKDCREKLSTITKAQRGAQRGHRMLAEVGPVDLALLARQRLEAIKGLCRFLPLKPTSQVAERALAGAGAPPGDRQLVLWPVERDRARVAPRAARVARVARVEVQEPCDNMYPPVAEVFTVAGDGIWTTTLSGTIAGDEPKVCGAGQASGQYYDFGKVGGQNTRCVRGASTIPDRTDCKTNNMICAK
jgi:hypothetical protein